jgi:hypothetical protein
MRDGLAAGGADDAIAATRAYISSEVQWAAYWQVRSEYENDPELHDAAMRDLADAVHAAQDLTSPEHEGKPWYGDPITGFVHYLDERHSTISSAGADEEARDEAIYETQLTWGKYQQTVDASRKQAGCRAPGVGCSHPVSLPTDK